MTSLKDDVKKIFFNVKPIDKNKPVVISHATPEDFKKFEAKFSIEIPESLKEWLTFCNGASIQPGEIYGINSPNVSLNIEKFYGIFEEWLSLGWMPLASDGCGDYYVLDTKYSIDGEFPVFFIDQEEYESPAYIVASNPWYFFYFLFSSELMEDNGEDAYWPFDKSKVVAKNPNILKFKRVPLPWET